MGRGNTEGWGSPTEVRPGVLTEDVATVFGGGTVVLSKDLPGAEEETTCRRPQHERRRARRRAYRAGVYAEPTGWASVMMVTDIRGPTSEGTDNVARAVESETEGTTDERGAESPKDDGKLGRTERLASAALGRGTLLGKALAR